MIKSQVKNEAHVLQRIPRLGVAKLHPGLHVGSSVYAMG